MKNIERESSYNNNLYAPVSRLPLSIFNGSYRSIVSGCKLLPHFVSPIDVVENQRCEVVNSRDDVAVETINNVNKPEKSGSIKKKLSKLPSLNQFDGTYLPTKKFETTTQSSIASQNISEDAKMNQTSTHQKAFRITHQMETDDKPSTNHSPYIFCLPEDEQAVNDIIKLLVDRAKQQQTVELEQRQWRSANSKKPGKLPYKRRKYGRQVKKLIVGIYKKYKVKQTALEKIRALDGFNSINRKMILEWAKKNGGQKVSGRPVCFDFENDVRMEYDKLRMETMNGVHCSKLLRQCGNKVLNNTYWDEESESYTYKWLDNKLTKNLKFSSKWVEGMFKRMGVTVVSSTNNTSSIPTWPEGKATDVQDESNEVTQINEEDDATSSCNSDENENDDVPEELYQLYALASEEILNHHRHV